MTDDELLSVAVDEYAKIKRFETKVLVMMVDVCARMRAVQKEIVSEKCWMLFEDQYNTETTVTYLAKSIVNMLRAMRCMDGQSHRNHVKPIKESELGVF